MRSKQKTPRSKSGCLTCRKRRVKCDEQRPICAKCLKWQTRCIYAPPAPDHQHASAQPGCPIQHASPESSAFQRGPGRPRKDWEAITADLSSTPDGGTKANKEHPPSPSPAITALGYPEHTNFLTLNASDLDLLSHFITHTGPSLGDPKNPNDHVSYLWAHHIPQLGQRFPLVLHLAFALTTRHMLHLGLSPKTRNAYERKGEADGAEELRTIGEFHFTRGLRMLQETLPHVNDDNCGALFVATKLLAFSMLAAGPRSPHDLLVCSVGEVSGTSISDASASASRTLWSPLGRDMRFIRESATDDVLFKGLLGSFRPGADPKLTGPLRDCRPTWLVFGMHRVSWEAPMSYLKKSVISRTADRTHDGEDGGRDRHAAVVRAFAQLERVYEATFGRDEDPTGDIEEPTDKVLIFWLYQLEDGFIENVQRKDPAAMLTLAYYSVLFQNLQSRWYLEGWSTHLIRTIATLVAPEYMHLLVWPANVVGIGNLDAKDERDSDVRA